jgi:HEPN/RES N-terminal domain 1/RES domain
VSTVCSNCFQDKTARRFIKKHGTVGNCGFCDSKRLKVLPAYQLRHLFDQVLSLYEQYEPVPGSDSWGGETLAECLQGWEIFNEDCEENVPNEILDEIMGSDHRDGDICASDDWQAKADHWAATPTHQRWPWFADHLKHSRRFIIEDDPTGELVRPEKWVPDLINSAAAVIEIKQDRRLFRGRMGTTIGKAPRAYRLPLPAKDMGAPPAKFARASRANSEGIPVLYCAFEPETAIVETGRFPGGKYGENRGQSQVSTQNRRGQVPLNHWIVGSIPTRRTPPKRVKEEPEPSSLCLDG